MKIIKCFFVFMVVLSSTFKSQTVSLVAESKNNLCLLNHEVVESLSLTAFTTEKISKAKITPDPYPEAVFVANNLNELLIANNLNSFTSPQYDNFQHVLAHPKLNFGNAVVADMNNDGLEDIAASNAFGDVYTCRRYSPSVFFIDTIHLTLSTTGHHARLYVTDMDNDPLPELLTIGANTVNPFGYRFGLYSNISNTTSTTLSFTPLSAGSVVTSTSLPDDNFSACVADLNNDGKDEVLFVSDLTTGSITVLYSSMSGNLDLKTSFDLGVSNLTNKKIMYADVNSDGQKEVILYGVLGSLIHFIYIYSENFSSGSPSAPVLQGTLPLQGPITDFDFADMNKDTLMDIITSVGGSNSGVINIYMAKDAAFNYVSPAPFNQSLHVNGGLALFDTDDNKRTDIFSFSTSTASSISILKNYTYRDTLYAIPSKSLICPGESVVLLTNLRDYGYLGYYSTYSPTLSLPAISQTMIANTAGVYSTSVTYSTLLTYPLYPAAASSCIVTSNTIQIKVGATPTISVSSPTTLCAGQTITISAMGANSYTWSTGEINTPAISITPTAQIIISVTGRSSDGCIGYRSDTIKVQTGTSANVAYNKILLCKNDKAILTASGGQTYYWSTGETTPTIQITQTLTTPQTYSVLVIAGNGCVKIASLQTVFNERCNEITVKTGITPNGDGSNDFLYIENIDHYPDNQVNVFNRWGTELYSVKGYDNTSKVWPAENNAKLTPGTYYYVIDFGNGDPIRKGWIEILSN